MTSMFSARGNRERTPTDQTEDPTLTSPIERSYRPMVDGVAQATGIVALDALRNRPLSAEDIVGPKRVAEQRKNKVEAQAEAREWTRRARRGKRERILASLSLRRYL